MRERRQHFPGMHVYHYNHTERSSLERLALEHGVGEVALAELVETGAFVDLLVVARNAVQAGVESYGLITAGQRVGITAFSHHAIDNLLEAVVELFQQRGELELLQGVKRGGVTGSLPNIRYVGSNPAAAKTKFNLVAGTTWLFASPDLARAPVDVLVVDEAGQLSLADTLAACRSAGNLLLLGDPLQLPQVAQASHPGTSGGSVLQHLLGDATTMPATRGVFLTETRRMHPDVCTFISDNIYESRLSSHTSCALQATQSGTGLRWLRAEHTGCSTYAAEEVELVHAEIRRLLGTTWVDQHGTATPLTVRDFLVVAPYNDQVNLFRERLAADPVTRGVATGHPWLHGHVYELRQGTRSAHQFLGDPWIRYWP